MAWRTIGRPPLIGSPNRTTPTARTIQKRYALTTASASILEMTFFYSDHFLEQVMTGKWSLNLYVCLILELHNNATVSSADESCYVELGFGPKYVFDGYSLTHELPTYVTFPGHGF